MSKKPTYKELEKKIAVLEQKIAELEGSKKAIQRSEERLKEAERIAKIGHWELDLLSNTLYWSDEIYRIFDLDPQEFGANYEAFLDAVHPEDRKTVDKAFTDSIKKRTGYDIVHRLLLKNGTLKYVHEKCRTLYDENGKPLRSLGTVQDITHQKRDEHRFSGIIGREPKMKDIFEMIREITDIDIPVLIQGESGTGKELVARAIHNEGPRANKAFVPVNCGALPEGLLESELFGHVKGSFTGALRDRKGRFEMANDGTLFLDEIADLPKVMQAKLLRVLQEGKFERVGDEKTITVDVRIISAANRNLKHEVEKGNFRDDLYYRISVVPIHMPPLRKRKNDIPLLVNSFLEKFAYKGQQIKQISENALSVMIDYPWPGNVRELQSAIHYALIKSRGKIIQPAHLPMELRKQKIIRPSRGPSLRLDPKIVKEALIRSGGNKAKAARYLGVGRATLYRFLNNFPDMDANIYESD
ncbi:MAG: sigma 54-interacting transcriptional regulator [Deltaproteobacteria bacterium]|jgi:PAS domain S-box-containing protein|nr:sigma 54-interacting transcriptional regulator [Deltaproteobacteria bacterium]